MTLTAIFVTYGFFALLLVAGVFIVIHNSYVIDKASKELEENPFPEMMRWLS